MLNQNISDYPNEIETGLKANKDFNSKSTLNKVAELYYSTAVQNTQWNKELYDIYKLYVHDLIGIKKVTDIKKLHIEKTQGINYGIHSFYKQRK